MEGRKHQYSVKMEWTGNLGTGTSGYREYKRNHIIRVDGKPDLPGSSDPVFRGEKDRYNPEDLLVAALSACHMLSYLHLCAVSNIVVLSYFDNALGTMVETADGGGRFCEVVLQPAAEVRKGTDLKLAAELHEKAHHLCFIASSVNFPVLCRPSFVEIG